MNCTNCGAAMELIESRRHLFCRYLAALVPDSGAIGAEDPPGFLFDRLSRPDPFTKVRGSRGRQ